MTLHDEWDDDWPAEDWIADADDLAKDFNPIQPRDDRGRWTLSGTISQSQTDQLLQLAGKRVTLTEKHGWARNLLVRAGAAAAVGIGLQVFGLHALPAWALGLVAGGVYTDLTPMRARVDLNHFHVSGSLHEHKGVPAIDSGAAGLTQIKHHVRDTINSARTNVLSMTAKSAGLSPIQVENVMALFDEHQKERILAFMLSHLKVADLIMLAHAVETEHGVE